MIFVQISVSFYAIFQILLSVHHTNGFHCKIDDRYLSEVYFLRTMCNESVSPWHNITNFFPITRTNGTAWLGFYVKGNQYARVLLSAEPKLRKANEPEKVYEIVLGGCNNTCATIRRTRLNGNKTHFNEKGIISPNEWREFWIIIDSDGSIHVARSSTEEVFMSWKEPNAFEINYYAFSSSSPNGHVDWMHDCSNDTKDPRQFFYEEDLICHLFQTYDHTRPTWVKANNTQIAVSCWYVNLDTMNDIFELRGMINYTWKDERLTWKPKDYGDHYFINVTSNNLIWKFELQLTNQVFAYEKFIEPGNTTLSSDGTITHIAPLNIRSRIKCTASSSSQLSDMYNCKLDFKMNIFRANITFSHNNYSDVISPWIITKTPPTIIRLSEKNETELLKKSIPINLTLERSISQPKSCSEFASNSSEKLRCQLFSNYSYNSSNMASQDHFQTFNLTIFYADIDVSGLFQMIGEVNVTWEDHQLTWEPSKYNNTYTLDIHDDSNQIWKPAYVLVNNLFYDNKPLLSSDHITTVTYQGKVTFWTRSISLQTKCPVLMRKRPWNEQICLLRFKANVSDAKFDIKQGAKTDIESPWTVHEIMTTMNSSLESPDNSILLHVQLIRNNGYFKSTRCISSASSYEEELKCHLLTKVHPNISSVQAFAFGPGVDMMISYIELNLENGILLLKGQQTMIWEDKRMAWDPEQFGDQFVIKMEEDALWKPCLVLDNELFQKGVNHGSYDNDDVVPTCNVGTGHLDVSSNGDVIWTSPMNLDTTCNMAFNSWPWDPLTCSLNFTTNTMDIKHLQVNLSRTELSRTKSLWTITNITKEFDDNFRMRFEITLEMNSCSLQVTLCLIFIGVSLVMLPSFLISPVSRIKLASKTLSFLLLAIFLLILINSIPHFTTRAPNFLIGLVVLLLTVGISTFVTAYLVRQSRESHSSNQSLNMEFSNPEENKRENGTMKTVVIKTTTRTDDEYTAEVPDLKKSQNERLKITAVIELSSFAICSIVVVLLITSLMS